jgi:NADPH:quinone reductase-like Zn-dependent oxidoreductase
LIESVHRLWITDGRINESREKMKAIRFHDYGSADQLLVEDIDPPVPGVGEVLVDVAAAAVNPVDYKLRSGWARAFVPLTLPYIPGGDFSGTIVAVGDGVSDARIGERVMGMVSVLHGGAYAERISVPAEEAVPVPAGLDLVEAATLPMGAMTGYDLIQTSLDVQAGECVVVTGAAGSVGRAAVHAAAARGATVVALVRAPVDMPISGAFATIVLPDDDAIAKFGPYDAVADAVAGDLAQALIAHIRPGGRFATVVNQLPEVPEGSDISLDHVIVANSASNLLHYTEALASGRVTLPASVRLPLDQAAEAHRRLEAGGVGGKLLLIP